MSALPNSSQEEAQNRSRGPLSVTTPLSAKIGLKYPLVSAPMFLISNPAMIIASAESGILGSMPSLNGRTHEDFRAMLDEVTNATSAPFAINLTIGLTDEERRKADLHACIDYGVKVLITSYGDPTEIVSEAHRHGMIVMHDVISLRHAFKAQSAGVDAIIGVSAGAGGHGGTLSPFAFIPWLKSSLDLPIVAAGCIGDGRQVLSALSLGAELCYMGTRFIASTECGASTAYKDLVSQATPDDIEYTDSVSGVHANFLRATLPEEGPRTRESPRKRWRDIWSAGQGVAQVSETLPIAEIVTSVMDGYHLALQEISQRSETRHEEVHLERTLEAHHDIAERLTSESLLAHEHHLPLSVHPREAPERFNLTAILIDEQLDAGRGDQPALICPEGVWSYRQLGQHISAFMRRLYDAGVRREERVLIAVKDSADFVAALLATVRFGAVGVMLNPDLEPDRVAELITYSRARAVFVERGSTAVVYGRACEVLREAQQSAEARSVFAELEFTILEVEGSERVPCPFDPPVGM